MLLDLLANFITRSNPHLFKRSQRGLFAGKTRLSGHRISFSNKKANRCWRPNVQKKTFYSELLDQKLKINVTTYAMRWIDKMGGLDNYLLFTKPSKIHSEAGLELRKVLIKKWEQKHKQKFNRSKILFERRLQEIEEKKRKKELEAKLKMDVATAVAR
jgi:large subunit ribosomal protein L28